MPSDAPQELMQHKLVFIETTDVLETTLALDNFRRACDCGRGAAFFSVARGKVRLVFYTFHCPLPRAEQVSSICRSQENFWCAQRCHHRATRRIAG